MAEKKPRASQKSESQRKALDGQTQGLFMPNTIAPEKAAPQVRKKAPKRETAETIALEAEGDFGLRVLCEKPAFAGVRQSAQSAADDGERGR